MVCGPLAWPGQGVVNGELFKQGVKLKSILGEAGGSECHGRWATTCCVSSETNARAGAQDGFVKWTLSALILGTTQMSSCGETIFCTRSSPKIKCNQYIKKVRIFGSMTPFF